MWYFSWILGVGLACSFAILNAMWFEMREDRINARKNARKPAKARKAGEH
jgi:cyd operon protein YbgT